jgi:hypothetical protein
MSSTTIVATAAALVPQALAPQVLADPIGVSVEVVAAVEPALDRRVIADSVAGVAGGRVKQRRLAQALLDRPDVLRDGRSPAPRVVADLLIALRRAGATKVSLPVCAGCGKRLNSFQRRGEDWYCAVCDRRPEPCCVCGQARPVNFRDRHGRPRCAQCPPEDERDPVDVVVDIVAGIDAQIPADVVAAAVNTAARQRGQRHQIAWALQDRPDLLTGGGADATAGCVLRLIDLLADAGSHTIVRPACPHCRRVIGLHRRIAGQWLCRNCVAKTRARPCAGCGAVREPGARDEHGQPLCPTCLIRQPANHETCTKCGRRRPVSVRTPDGPRCETCRPWKTGTCTICGKTGPSLISKTTGLPWCRACKQRWARCTDCGQDRPVRGGTLNAPLCATCTRPDPDFWRACPGCGEPGRIHAGPNARCARCTMHRRLRELLGDDTGDIRPEVRVLHQALTAADRPATVDAWLNRSAAPKILHALAGRALTHDALDALPPGKPVEHLRSVLVAIGTLPHRDEQLTRLQRWIGETIAARPSPDQQHLLRRYAIWHVLRRLRGRLNGTDATHHQLVAAKRPVQAAVALLDWLTSRNRTLGTARQDDLDAWLAEEKVAGRVTSRDAGNFIRWANRNKLTTLELPATRWGGPAGVIDTEARWQRARHLLHDDSLNPEDRVAGLLVLLYAQQPAAISRLTLDHVQISGDDTRIQLGREPVVLPAPLDGLVRDLVCTRRGHATIGVTGTSPWLFPGGQPGRPISAFQLAERLRQLRLNPAQSRSTALFQLATELPAALLARALGIHISVAVTWQRASAGDWATYAADVARRAETGRTDNPPPNPDRQDP